MDGFRANYLLACDKDKVVASDLVLQNLRDKVGDEKGHGRLDLSGCSLSVGDCHALSKALLNDAFFNDVRLTDCLLTEDACLVIINALSLNRVIKKLDLKGNNVRYRGAEAVGKLLKRTASLSHLRLEWNSLGLWESGIKSIAEGVALNQTLRFLDLRNNQISHEGAADLAGALKRNRVLRTLDIRWNNIGIIGGRAFLSGLKHNHTLTKFEIGGNNIPTDVVKAIEAAVQKNSDRAAVYAEQDAVMSVVQQELTTLENEKRMQVSSLVDHLAREKELHDQFTKSADEKITQLKLALDSKSTDYSKLLEQYNTCEDNVRGVEQKNRDLMSKIDQLHVEIKRQEEDHDTTLCNLKGEVERLKSAHHEEQSRLLSKLREHEKSEVEYQLTVSSLKDTIESMRKTSQKTETLHLEDLGELERKYKKELDALQLLLAGSKASNEERIKRLENENSRLQDELSRLKTDSQSDKLRFEEEKLHMINRWKQDELQRTKQYEERFNLLQDTKDELQAKSMRQANEMKESMSQLSRVSKELEQFKYQNAELKRDLETREQDLRTQANEYRREESNMRERATKADAELADIRRKSKETEDRQSAEIARLRNQVEEKQSDLLRMREEELRRASMLETAFHSYISSAKSPYKA